ncbi:MAG TPA: hypothetical protein DCY13_12600, partial [Verrucomicrobiales bacterium]|nr:hypothetical protein [Verrucomicrobiales bacterium]
LMTQFPVGDRVLITKDGDLHWCKVEDGSTELLLETGSKHGRVTRIDATHALVSRLGENYDQSMVVDLSSATVVWRNSGPAD